MTQQHPITPPPELVEEWHSNSPFDRGLTVATQAAQWGADQEPEACVAWLDGFYREGWAATQPAPLTASPPSLNPAVTLLLTLQ